jgi:cytochrome c-type biogenesis protein CcmH/NrfG
MAVKRNEPSRSSTAWTGTHYALALVCLGIGLLMGWFLRGSGSSAAPTQTGRGPAPTMAPGTIPGSIPQGQSQPPLDMVNKQAESLLTAAKANPTQAGPLIELGNLYYDTQYYQQAVDYYAKALQLQPANVNVRTDMGTAYFYMGQNDRAIAEFEKSLKNNPTHPNTLFNMGIVKWQGKSDSNGAVAAWEKLLQTNPDYPEKQKVLDFISRAKQHGTMPGFGGNKS